jgi:hypothetical protein
MRSMDWRSLSNAQVSYLLDVIETAHWESGSRDLDVWRSLADEAERRGLTDAAAEARETIAEIEAPPRPTSQPEPLASHLPHVHVTFADQQDVRQ